MREKIPRHHMPGDGTCAWRVDLAGRILPERAHDVDRDAARFDVEEGRVRGRRLVDDGQAVAQRVVDAIVPELRERVVEAAVAVVGDEALLALDRRLRRVEEADLGAQEEVVRAAQDQVTRGDVRVVRLARGGRWQEQASAEVRVAARAAAEGRWSALDRRLNGVS